MTDTTTMVEPTIVITSRTGVRFRVRILREGDAYGLTGALICEKPLVEFYDTRYSHTPFGQFVSRYYVEEILNDGHQFHRETAGLNLDGGVPDWQIDANSMSVIRAWIAHEA